jgi:predicted ribosomally synthesized peptide with SipW-like signal peptide
MTHGFTVSRRKVLAGLGTIGVASAGAGLGTTAFFSDEESLDASLDAGRVDLLLDYRATYVPWDRQTPFATMSGTDSGASDDDRVPGTDYDGDGTDDRFVLDQRPNFRRGGLPYSEDEWGETTLGIPCDYGEGLIDFLAENDGPDGNYLVDGFTPVVVDLADVKPRDTGEITTSLHLCDNRAFLWMRAVVDEDLDNGLVEPEVAAMDPDGPDGSSVPDFSLVGSDGGAGELDDYLHVRVFHDDNCNNVYDEGEDDIIFQGSLAAFAEFAADGVALDGDRSTPEPDCFDARTEEGFLGATDLAGAVHCVAVEWYLPCMNVDDPDGEPLPTPGFSELPSDAPGAETLADELDAKGLPYEEFDAINVVQTDSLSFTLQYYAVQCRHNMANANPFGGDGVVT